MFSPANIFPFAQVCLAGLAAADADAQYFAGHGYNHAYAGHAYAGHALAYSAPLRYGGAYGYAAPATGAAITVRGYGTPATVATYQPYGYAASGQYHADSFGAVHIAKREAEAEPEAEADAYYGYSGYHGYSGLYNGYSSYRPAVYTSSYARPVYSSYGYSRPAVYGGYHHAGYYGKRSAEAEPEAEAYYGYAAHPYAHNYGYAHFAKSAPCVNAANVPVPCQHGYSAVAAPAVYGGYHHAGYYGKRSAEAEPEAEAYYGSYGYSAYSPVYSGYSSYSRPVYATSYARPVYSGYGYSRLGYGYHY